jgi:hypothetical protein
MWYKQRQWLENHYGLRLAWVKVRLYLKNKLKRNSWEQESSGRVLS